MPPTQTHPALSHSQFGGGPDQPVYMSYLDRMRLWGEHRELDPRLPGPKHLVSELDAARAWGAHAELNPSSS